MKAKTRFSEADGSISLKWISVAQHRSKTELTVNADVNKRVFRPTRSNKCNLISVFGAARQGKSFLMNCLAGETELFKISNQRESCTQGIDISHHLIPLSAFSSIHGGRRVEDDTNIGFVDAEGQGDRDVTYDANLICPVLLVSKAVIFNWKDSMQKDKILNQLGILHKAAINVACEDESISDASDQKIFGHLHLVFRDWQYEGSDEKSVYNDIFKEERSAETAAAVRNQIRRSVKENFESITVWLFPAPVKDSAQLSTRLSYEITQISFKQQLGALRAKLSSQLADPSIFDGKALCGNTIGGIVETIANVLNTGEAVRPKPAWVSMICSEIEQTRLMFEKTLRQECEKMLSSFEKKCQCVLTSVSAASRRLSADDAMSASGRISLCRTSLNVTTSLNISKSLLTSDFPSWGEAEASLRRSIQHLYGDYKADVDAIAGVTVPGAAPSTLSAEDFTTIEAAVLRSIESEKANFSARYGQLCNAWTRSAKTKCLEVLNSECTELQAHVPYVDSELNEAMEEFLGELSFVLQDRLDGITAYLSGNGRPKVATKGKNCGDTVMKLLEGFILEGCQADKLDTEDTIRNIRHAADLQFQVVRHVNDESKRKAENSCRECLKNSQRKLCSAVDEMIRSLASYSAGISKTEFTATLDGHFKVIYDDLWAGVTALPLGHQFVDSFAEELAQTGRDLKTKVDDAYSAALHRYATFVVTEAKKSLNANTDYLMESDEPFTEDYLLSMFQHVIDKVGDVSVQSLSKWTFENNEREDWFEGPLRQAAEERLQGLRFVNKKMIDAAARAALLSERAENEKEQFLSKKRKIDSKPVKDEPDEQPTAKHRRGTKKISSTEEDEQYDMDVEPSLTLSSSKARRQTKKFVDEDDDEQYDVYIAEKYEDSDITPSASSTGRLPSVGTSLAEQKRKAKEWAMEQRKAKASAKKGISRPPTPPIADSSEEEGSAIVVQAKGKGKKGCNLPITKLSKEEAIQQAKEKARQTIEHRKQGKLAQLEEDEMSQNANRRMSRKNKGDGN